QGAVKGEKILAFRARQGAAVGALGKGLERLEVARLRGQPGPFHAANVRGNALEVLLDGLDRGALAPAPARLGDVSLREPLDHGLGRRVLVLGAGEVELRALHEPRWLGALEENIIPVLPQWGKRDEIELFPEGVELPPPGLIENEPAERRIIPKVSH